jgi:iron complex transport system permease protein
MRRGWFVAVPLLLIGVVASLFIGVIDVSPAALFSADSTMSVMAISRIPRTVAIILTGSSMAVAGLIMQMIVANRFVEPMTAGSGSSAALGVLLVTFFMPAASIFTKMLIACLVSLVGTAGFLMLVRRLPTHQPLLVPLVGIAYGGVIGAIVTFIGYQTDLLQYIEVWFNGEFSGILQGRYELLWLVGVLTLLAYFVADQFAILGLGKNVSINLGLNYQQIVRLGLLIVSLITAMTVVTVGMIPFVGLVVPNIISRWLGDNLRQTLPVTALMGACLVLVSDLIGRLVRYPFEIPVGTIFGIVGAMIFLWILYMPATTKRSSNSDKREDSKC